VLTKVDQFITQYYEGCAFAGTSLLGLECAKYNYLRISLLNDVAGDDILDCIMEGDNLCELVIIPSGNVMDEAGEFCLAVDPGRPETARIISNSNLDDFHNYGVHQYLQLEHLVEYFEEVLGCTESASLVIAAIVKAHVSHEPSIASHFSAKDALYATEECENYDQIAVHCAELEQNFEYSVLQESDSGSGLSGNIALAVSTCDGWDIEHPEIAILESGRVAVCSEEDFEDVDWTSLDSVVAAESISVFDSLNELYGSFSDGCLEVIVFKSQEMADSWVQ